MYIIQNFNIFNSLYNCQGNQPNMLIKINNFLLKKYYSDLNTRRATELQSHWTRSCDVFLVDFSKRLLFVNTQNTKKKWALLQYFRFLREVEN